MQSRLILLSLILETLTKMSRPDEQQKLLHMFKYVVHLASQVSFGKRKMTKTHQSNKYGKRQDITLPKYSYGNLRSLPPLQLLKTLTDTLFNGK